MRIISGIYGGRSIKTTKGEGYRPATGKVREALFSMLQSRGVRWSACRALDLFAGSGSLGIEALSRGADFVMFVENNPEAAGLIRGNLKSLDADNARFMVTRKDVLSFLSRPPGKTYDLVFIDPPYGFELLSPSLERLVEHNWLSASALVSAEVEAGLNTENIAPKGLNLLTDRLYGQTRILLWETKE